MIVAAGRGLRFGSQKQFAAFDGATVAAHSVRAARSVASRVVLVVPDDYVGDGEGADEVVVGGATRSESVRAGLDRCGDVAIVVVHDAARPLASPALFSAVVDAVTAGADCAVPGLAITDTVKRVVRDDVATLVSATVSREDLVTVQTPQAFAHDALRRAHDASGDATDDAALVEAIGGRCVVVSGEVTNIKITVAGDVERLAQLRKVNS